MAELLLVVAVIIVGLRYRPAEWWVQRAKQMVSSTSTSTWNMAVALWLILVVASLFAATPLPIFIALASFVPFWVNELRLLFASTDEDFPGRNDKLIWALYLLFCPPLGVVFFRKYRERNWTKSTRASAEWL